MVSEPTENQNEFYGDSIELVRRVMEDMFILLFFEEQAHHRIGFTKISRLIGQEPGWYLWTKERKGAYLLELIDIEDFHREARLVDMPNLNIHPAVRAEFIVRYYPSPEEPSFNDFAFIERETRLGPSFDHTGTPFFGKQDELHESLFTVGKFHLAFDKGLDFASLSISSQDRWIEIAKNREGGKVIPEEAKVRNVRGWELSWHLFDKLLLGFCYVHKSFPFGLALTEYPATIYHIYAPDQVVEAHEPEVYGRTIEAGVLLQSVKGAIDPGVLKETFLQSVPLSLKKDEVLVDYFGSPPEEERPWINPDWWRAPSWTFPPPGEIQHHCFNDH
jgi:hypothetical protein